MDMTIAQIDCERAEHEKEIKRLNAIVKQHKQRDQALMELRAFKLHGISKGAVVWTCRTSKDAEKKFYQVMKVDEGFRGAKGWAKGYLHKKDGTLGVQAVHLYNDWEIETPGPEPTVPEWPTEPKPDTTNPNLDTDTDEEQ